MKLHRHQGKKPLNATSKYFFFFKFQDSHSSGSKAAKILGDIMGKLSKSIDVSTEKLSKNPVLSLGLARGFTKSGENV